MTHLPKTAHLLRQPAAYATAYSPCGRRRRWAAMVRCPECRGGHLIFAADRDHLSGIKTTGCGAKVFVVVDLVVAAVETMPGEARAA